MHPIDEIISIKDMKKEHAVEEFIQWVGDVLEAIPKDRETSKIIRGNYSELWKRFTEETIPMRNYLIASKVDGSAIVYMPSDNQQYDASITKGNEVSFFEITTAKDGQQDSLRSQLINRDGSVPAYGQVKVSGAKASGKQEITAPPLIATSVQAVIDEKLQLIQLAINKKIEKDYPTQMRLIVSFDDYCYDFEEGLENGVLEIIQNLPEHNFLEIIVIGAKGKRYS